VARKEATDRARQKAKAEGREWKRKDPSPLAHLRASEIGALSEMAACSDLLRRGYQVFRALSPSAPCDLVVLAENRCYRVEVKTAHRSGSGRLGFATRDFDPTKHDVLALVTPDGVVTYRPEWPRPS
jgi:hypothetical protein